MREKYESLPLSELRQVAKARGLKGISTLRKDELVNRMVQEDEKEKNDQADKEDAASAERPVQRYERRERTDYQERMRKQKNMIMGGTAPETRGTTIRKRTFRLWTASGGQRDSGGSGGRLWIYSFR